jgi:hypothetical protein
MLKPAALITAAAIVFTCVSAFAGGPNIRQPKLTLQNSGTTQGLIAISPVNPRVVWASGRGWNVHCHH